MLLLFVAMGVAACAGDDDSSGAEWQGDWTDESATNEDGGAPATTTTGSDCKDGDTEVCHLTIGRHNDVLTCYEGIQKCVDGTWGGCGDGVVTNYPSVGPELSPEKSTSTSSSQKWKSYSKAQDCKNNPCDPTCKDFDENPPDGGWFVDGEEFIYTWKQGNKGKIPDEYAKKAFTEPCEIGNDCQLNHYCYDPGSGNCSHDVCTTGGGLKAGCSRCTTEICKTKPQCCEKKYGGACAHEPCITGSGLKKSCDPFVKKTCDWDKTCCPYSVQKTICNWVKTPYQCKKTYDCWAQKPCLKKYQCGWTPYTCKKCGNKYQCWYAPKLQKYYSCWYVKKLQKYYSCWKVPYSYKKYVCWNQKACGWKTYCYYKKQLKCSYQYKCYYYKVCSWKYYQYCYQKYYYSCQKVCSGWGWFKKCYYQCTWKSYTVCTWKKYLSCYYKQSCYWYKSCYWQYYKYCYQQYSLW
jgi:hypothetical protein